MTRAASDGQEFILATSPAGLIMPPGGRRLTFGFDLAERRPDIHRPQEEATSDEAASP
jgi:hypothetical protein